MVSESVPLPSGPASASVQPWAERSKRDVFLDALTGVRPGTSRPTRAYVLRLLAIVAVAAFLLPKVVLVGDVDSIPYVGLVLVSAVVSISQAAFDQLRLGRPLSRAVIAGLGAALMILIAVLVFVGFSLVLGQPAEGSRLYAAVDAILPDIQREVVMLLLSIPVIAGIAYLVYRAAQGFPDDPRDIEIKASIRAERAARAAATGREAVPILRWAKSRVIP